MEAQNALRLLTEWTAMRSPLFSGSLYRRARSNTNLIEQRDVLLAWPALFDSNLIAICCTTSFMSLRSGIHMLE